MARQVTNSDLVPGFRATRMYRGRNMVEAVKEGKSLGLLLRECTHIYTIPNA